MFKIDSQFFFSHNFYWTDNKANKLSFFRYFYLIRINFQFYENITLVIITKLENL